VQAADDPVEVFTGTGAHFQMFRAGRPPMVRWRLLSGNNRDMAHGSEHFADEESCRRGIAGFVASISQAHPVIKRDDQGDWIWVLMVAGVPVANAGHSYDRQIRCARALSKVMRDAPTATISDQLVISDHRRWTGSTRVLTATETTRSLKRFAAVPKPSPDSDRPEGRSRIPL
jgi:uncharacterized protein YegP (UPF0339 family)